MGFLLELGLLKIELEEKFAEDLDEFEDYFLNLRRL